MSTQSYAPTRRHGFISSLEGLRALASLGVLATHVAFQTAVDPATAVGAVLARFDFFVAVFFALSAFVLWRRRAGQSWAQYYFKRFARIMPAYWVCVLAVLLFIPSGPWLANLSLTQIFWPSGLMTGLTHLWSLCVEMVFYLVLPLFALLLDRFGKKQRILLILGFSLLSLGWAWLPIVESATDRGLANMQIWPPSYMCWFAVGLIAAELEGMRFPKIPYGIWVVLSLIIAWVAGQEWYGPLGLVHPSPAEFNLRILAGTAFAAVLVVPLALGTPSAVLSSAPMQKLGLWSYSIFLWHLPVLTIVFPLLGIPLFDGHFLLVFVATVLLTIPVAAASYVLVEQPVQQWSQKVLKRQSQPRASKQENLLDN